MFDQIADQFRVLGDETRLRILRLLREESLNVGELIGILGLAQPTVSKHLAELKRVGLVDAARNSGYSFYRILPRDEQWWETVSAALARMPDTRGDLVRLQEILHQRSENAEVQDRFVVPGRSWLAWTRAMKFLLPNLKVADFGCGDGALTVEIAGWAQEIIAIDCNPTFLKLAQERAAGLSNVRFLQEEMDRVSIPNACIDLVVISQSLHYLDDPLPALREAYRILKAGGRLLVLDLLPHGETWVLSQLKHRKLGFEMPQLRKWLQEAGFTNVETDTIKQGPEPFRISIVAGTKTEDNNR